MELKLVVETVVEINLKDGKVKILGIMEGDTMQIIEHLSANFENILQYKN